MYWWKKQPLSRRILLSIAVLALVAGFTGTKEALIGGIFIFILFLILSFFVPTGIGQSSEDKNWRAVISPHLYGKEKVQRLTLSVLAFGISLIVMYYLFYALLTDNYVNALLFTLILMATISSLVYLFPRLYNEIFLRSKIIPLSKEMDTKKLCEEIEKVKTPAGIPLLGYVEGIKEIVAVYRIIDFNWIVYFYVHNNEVIINARILFAEDLDPEKAEWVYSFTQDLADLICFYVNTGKLPDKTEMVRIFK